MTVDFNFKYIPLWIAGTLVGWKIEGFIINIILCDYEIMSYLLVHFTIL